MVKLTCLETFVRRRRDPTKIVTLWVDALCINQEDYEEKNRQIPLMAMVYGAARAATIWLGPADANSDLAMRYLGHLG